MGRAELLHGLWLADQHAASEQGLALAAGYVRYAVESDETAIQDDDHDQRPAHGVIGHLSYAAQQHNRAQAEIPRARFWAVTDRLPVHIETDHPERLTRASIPLEPSDLMPVPGGIAPAWQPIAPPARLMPALKRCLQAQRLGDLDIAQLVHILAHGKTLRRLPKRAHKGWTDRLLVVLDLSEALLPYHTDMHQLASDLRRWIGRSHAKVRVIGNEHQPQGPWQEWKLDIPQAQRSQAVFGEGWEISAFASRVLLLSEMGLMARDAGQTSEAWAAWLHELGKQGTDVQVWCPLPIGLPSEPKLAPLGWQRAAANMPRVSAVHWSAANPMRRRPLPTADLHRTTKRLALAGQLRTRLATVSRAEPALLRTLRLGMDASTLDAGLEHLAWDHPDLSRHFSARALIPASLASYRAEFCKLPSAQKLKTLDALAAHHMPYNPLLAHVEILAWAAYAAPSERRERQTLIDKAFDVMHRFAHDPWQLTQLARGEVLAFMARHLHDADKTIRALCSPYMSQLMVALHRERYGDAPLRESLDGLSTSDVAMALGKTLPTIPMWLTLDDEHGWLMLTHEKPQVSRLLDPQPVEVGALSIHMAHHTSRWEDVKPPRDIALARLPWGLQDRQVHNWFKYYFAPFPPPVVNGPIRLDTCLESITINEVPRPSWALEWARNQDGLYAVAPNPWGAVLRVLYPMTGGEQKRPLFHMREFTGKGGRKADSFMLDIDLAGLIAHLTIESPVTQSFRFLPPGQFIMGTPDAEEGKFDNESPSHLVTFAEGFWIADTACTQALWLAVMDGKNPSRFKGDGNLPVEQVTWVQVQNFLKKLNLFLPVNVVAKLPTEAEWEYACRAGTSTQFSFGDSVSCNEVNYRGDIPYFGGRMSKSINRTIPVKSLPPNAWGMYQMHGNVWEWCENEMYSYKEAILGVGNGLHSGVLSQRVIRGGGWSSGARSARSAQRQQRSVHDRYDYLGFRFVLKVNANVQGESHSPHEK